MMLEGRYLAKWECWWANKYLDVNAVLQIWLVLKEFEGGCLG